MEAQPARESRSSQPVESSLPRLESLLKDWIRHGGFELGVVIRKNQPTDDDPEAPEFVIDFSGPDSDLLVERGASLLNALEYLVFKAVRLDEELFGRITLDCRDWRRLRARELQLTAQVAAERVVDSGDPFTLSPMSARERRIVHLALRNNLQVRTVSEGFGPERRVVILPASPPQRPRSS